VALVRTEQANEAISECDTAIRLSPRDPLVWLFYTLRARARFLLGDYEAAQEDARRALRHPANSFYPHAILASALAHLDRGKQAKVALDKLLEIKPDFHPDAMMAGYSPLDPEALRPQFKTMFDGLRKAGLDIPDEPTAGD
jgi:tetratricopeptide (TPR) repeat protein